MKKPVVIINKFDSDDVIVTSGGLSSVYYHLSGAFDGTNDNLEFYAPGSSENIAYQLGDEHYDFACYYFYNGSFSTSGEEMSQNDVGMSYTFYYDSNGNSYETGINWEGYYSLEGEKFIKQ